MRREGISTWRRPPKGVPLIKFVKEMCLFYNIYLFCPKNKKILNKLREIKNEKSGLRSSL